MDLETENRIASILMKEAAELRRQAEKEGVHVYLHRPKTRGRPNSRFLTATVLGVQQANRAVEVNEMWRVRQKELELDDRHKGRLRDGSSGYSRYMENSYVHRSTAERNANRDMNTNVTSSLGKRATQDCYAREDDGLRDDEIEEFLQSRIKRGRGTVGSRMDDTGPYLPPCLDSESASPGVRSEEKAEGHIVFGPEKPSLLKSRESSEEHFGDRQKGKKSSSNKLHSRKHRSKGKPRDKEKRRKDEKRCKHH